MITHAGLAPNVEHYEEFERAEFETEVIRKDEMRRHLGLTEGNKKGMIRRPFGDVERFREGGGEGSVRIPRRWGFEGFEEEGGVEPEMEVVPDLDQEEERYV